MMNFNLADLAQLITAIVLALNFYVTWRNGKKATDIANNMASLEKNTNSKMDSLLVLTAKSSKAEGVAIGRAEALPTVEPLKVDIVKVPKV